MATGVSCADAIERVFRDERGSLTAPQVIARIDGLYPGKPWKKNTISQHLMGLSLNHTSAHYMPGLATRAFLHWTRGGVYRRWDPERDGPMPEDIESELGDLPEPESEAEVEALMGAIDTSVSLERDLERALLRDLGQLEPGLLLYREGGVSGQQLDTGVVGRLDVLAVDAQGDLVVIELKAGTANERVIGQVLRYMGWVDEALADGRSVRGIIVADAFDSAVRYAARAMPSVFLRRYEVRFEFCEA